MALTLVRHTTPDVAKGTCYGRTDLALADSFEVELRDVRAAIPTAGGVVTSPLTRCHRLADRIATQAGVDVRPEQGWIEMDFGAWEGRAWSDIPRDDLDGWAADFMGYAGHGGESVAMLEERVRTALNATPPDCVIVTHSGCIRAVCAILNLHDGWDTETPFGGIVRLP
jgi:alpha-ribazole phosphatase